MLINRSYRTYVYDYPQLIGLAGHHAAPACPNNISSIAASITSTTDVTEDLSLSVKINSGAVKRCINLYSGDTTGKVYDHNRSFWGEFQSRDLMEYGFIGIFINGIKYYLAVYDGSTSAVVCSSNLVGDFYTTGAFNEAGFALLNINGTALRYVLIYTKL
jgi:hypothetical protein